MADEKIGVVGAGTMGAEIALVYALGGHEVKLFDQSSDLARAALTRLGGVLATGIKRGFYTQDQADAALARLHVATVLEEYADCDLVVEAVFEDEAVKAAVFEH